MTAFLLAGAQRPQPTGISIIRSACRRYLACEDARDIAIRIVHTTYGLLILGLITDHTCRGNNIHTNKKDRAFNWGE